MTGSKQTPILVVDDYSMIVRIIRHHLKRIGFENVDSASNGAEALAKMATNRYALIISDWHMEPMTGLQLLQKVRADETHANVPFIMATIESRAEYIIAARNAGATDYILKPFNAAILRASIAYAFTPARERSFHFDGSLVSPGFAAPRKAAMRPSSSLRALAE